jgi:hypothetical protein
VNIILARPTGVCLHGRLSSNVRPQIATMSLIHRIFGPRQLTKPRQEPLIAPDSQLRRVYYLTDELQANPRQVELAQALTRDKSRPSMGLLGKHGLFASEEWWNSINTGRIGLRRVAGTVNRVYEAGQDRMGVPNTVDLDLDDGSRTTVGIYVNDKRDVKLFKPGRRVELVYALDVLKADHGSGRYLEIALEMAVSVE